MLEIGVGLGAIFSLGLEGCGFGVGPEVCVFVASV